MPVEDAVRFVDPAWREKDKYYCKPYYNNYQCDLTVHKTRGMWHIAVESGRVPDGVKLPPIDWTSPYTFVTTFDAQLAIVRRYKPVAIGLPYDNRTFVCHSLESLQAKLILLRETGYRIPQQVFDDIKEEMDGRPCLHNLGPTHRARGGSASEGVQDDQGT